MKQRIILVIAIVFGLLAALLTRQFLVAKDRQVKEQIAAFNRHNQTVDVIVLNKALPAGSVISREDIGSLPFIERQLRYDTVRDSDWRDLVGRKTLNRIDAGKPVFWTDIEGGAPGSRGLAEDIKAGCRAISINVAGAAAVSGMVKPNDRIDVIGTFSFPSREHPGELELVTLTILQDVTVLATGTETAKTALHNTRPRSTAAYGIVTLEVTPREAEMLVFAEQIKGRLSLALRNPTDVHYESELPRVNFEKIEQEIESLNTYRQRTLLRKRE
jgi:Flp pilus assembly protein CpaB